MLAAFLLTAQRLCAVASRRGSSPTFTRALPPNFRSNGGSVFTNTANPWVAAVATKATTNPSAVDSPKMTERGLSVNISLKEGE